MSISDHHPKVSILIPVYNTEAFIAETIESVLNQTFNDWELIIVDDCSIDRTFSICQRYAANDKRIRLYRNSKNLGMMANWNYGVDLCHPLALYWGKLDADDIWTPNVVSDCVDILDSDPEAGLVCGEYVCIDENSEVMDNSYYSSPEFAKDCGIFFTELVLLGVNKMFSYGIAQQGIGLLRKSIFSDLGKFSLLDAGDTEMWFRVGCHYKIYTCSKLFHYHRVWEKNFTRSNVLNLGKSKKNIFEVRQAILDYYFANQVLNNNHYRKFSKNNRFEYDKYLLYQHRSNARIKDFIKLLLHNLLINPDKLIRFYTDRLFARF